MTNSSIRSSSITLDSISTQSMRTVMLVMELDEVMTQFPRFFFNKGLRASAIWTLAKKFSANIIWGGAVGPTPALQIRTSIPSG